MQLKIIAQLLPKINNMNPKLVLFYHTVEKTDGKRKEVKKITNGSAVKTGNDAHCQVPSVWKIQWKNEMKFFRFI